MVKVFIVETKNYSFGVCKGTYVSLLNIAKLIWPDNKNYYNIVRKKAINQVDGNAELCRVGMMSDSIYVDVTKLRAILTSLCHRDKLAKELLSEFDFSFIQKALTKMHKKLFAEDIVAAEAVLATLKEDTELMLSKYENIVI